MKPRDTIKADPASTRLVGSGTGVANSIASMPITFWPRYVTTPVTTSTVPRLDRLEGPGERLANRVVPLNFMALIKSAPAPVIVATTVCAPVAGFTVRSVFVFRASGAAYSVPLELNAKEPPPWRPLIDGPICVVAPVAKFTLSSALLCGDQPKRVPVPG